MPRQLCQRNKVHTYMVDTVHMIEIWMVDKAGMELIVQENFYKLFPLSLKETQEILQLQLGYLL